MDNDDKEFETFLEQFELRHQRPFPQEKPVEAGRRMQWWILAVGCGDCCFTAFDSTPPPFLSSNIPRRNRRDSGRLLLPRR